MNEDEQFESIMNQNDMGEQEQPTLEELVLTMSLITSALDEIARYAANMVECPLVEDEDEDEVVEESGYLSPASIMLMRQMCDIAGDLIHVFEDDFEKSIVIEDDEDDEEE
jgi:hypothetical protein